MTEPMHQLVPLPPSTAVGSPTAGIVVPALIADAGEQATRRFLAFFTVTIRNRNTRMAYYRAVLQFFAWCDRHQLGQLVAIEPLHVAAYIEGLQQDFAKPSVKQHLAAIRMLFDWLVTGGMVATNPAHAVRGPTHVVKRGKTPVLTPAEARVLLDSIDVSTVVGLRDRALRPAQRHQAWRSRRLPRCGPQHNPRGARDGHTPRRCARTRDRGTLTGTSAGHAPGVSPGKCPCVRPGEPAPAGHRRVDP